MAVLEFRTYKYKVYGKPAKVTIDANGDPVQEDSQESVSDAVPCDIVEAGSPNTIQTQDGKLIAYNYSVHCAPGTPELYIGQRMKIFTRDDVQIFEGSIKGFKHHQLKTVIWV